jgi:hypothetical protein
MKEERKRPENDSEKDEPIEIGVDPDESPFATPGVEGIPYKRGSREDLAVRRVIEEHERKRATAARGD